MANKTKAQKYNESLEKIVRFEDVTTPSELRKGAKLVKGAKAIEPKKAEEVKIPKELESLAKEARKYKSAEEFEKNLGQGLTDAGEIHGNYNYTLETRKISELSPTYYPQQYEINLQKEYAKDIKKGKYVPPIQIEKDGTILDGNRRLVAYKFAGKKEVPVLVKGERGDGTITNITDFYTQAVKGVEPVKVEAIKPKVKVVRVSETQLPVGEGKEKVSRLEARMKDTLRRASQDEIERLGLSTYKQLNNKENIAKATEYVVNNSEEALAILKGDIDPPRGILKNSIYIALKNLGSSDTELATKIASLASTRYGQEISILREIESDSPVTLMENIVRTKIKAYEKRTGKKVNDRIKSEVKKMDKSTSKITKDVWEEFINSLIC